MSGLSTHILNTATGRPAAGLVVTLERQTADGWQRLSRSSTNDDGRVVGLLPDGESLQAATYRLHFATGDYFAATATESFYPEATVVFRVADSDQHFHVPLLLAPWGYSTYRGS